MVAVKIDLHADVDPEPHDEERRQRHLRQAVHRGEDRIEQAREPLIPAEQQPDDDADGRPRDESAQRFDDGDPAVIEEASARHQLREFLRHHERPADEEFVGDGRRGDVPQHEHRADEQQTSEQQLHERTGPSGAASALSSDGANCSQSSLHSSR